MPQELNTTINADVYAEMERLRQIQEAFTENPPITSEEAVTQVEEAIKVAEAEVAALAKEMLSPPKPEHGSEFRVVTEQMTRAEAAASRKPGLRERKCVVYTPNQGGIPQRYIGYNVKHGLIVGVGNQDCVSNIDAATVFTVGAVIGLGSDFPNNDIVLILDEEQLAKEPPRRRFEMEKYLNRTLVELAKVAPKNPTMRAHFQRIFNTPMPDSVEDYQQIKDWVEFSFDPPGPPPKLAYETLAGAPQRDQNAGIQVDVTLSERELGTCTYSHRRSVNCEVPIQSSQIRELINDGRTIDEIVENLIGDARDMAEEYDPGGGETGDMHYDNYESADSEDRETTVNPDQVRQALVNYISSQYGPEEAEEIFDRE